MNEPSYAYNEAKMMDGIKNHRRDLALVPTKTTRPPSPNRTSQLKLEVAIGKKVLLQVAEGFAISPADISSPLHLAHLCHAREVAVFVLRREYGQSLQAVGRAISRHHTSVVHAERKAAEHYVSHKPFRDLVNSMCTRGRLLTRRDALGLPTAIVAK